VLVVEGFAAGRGKHKLTVSLICPLLGHAVQLIRKLLA